MQGKNFKKILTFALILSMMMPLGTVAADSAEEDADTGASAEAADSGDEGGDDDDGEAAKPKAEMITEETALGYCVKAAENDKYTLYLDEENKRLCLQVKASGKCWWTSPINAEADPTVIDEKGSSMKSGQISVAQSSLAINVGDVGKRSELPAPEYSASAKVSFKTEANGVSAEYDFGKNGVKLTAHYELTDRGLYMYVNTDEIVEADPDSEEGKVLTKLVLAPYMGAASTVDDRSQPIEGGYMIVPDGSGAVINYNNGRSNYASYQQKVYGRDYTTVLLNAPKVTEQAYMPVMATVQGGSGLVMIATDGEANVFCNAQVSGQNKQAYNNCYFMFETRSSDEFFMSGTDSNKLTVFEKYGIKTPRFGVEYIPVESEDGVTTADCAAVYRNYLETDKGLTQKTEENSSQLYVDTYGAVRKKESVLGLPIIVRKKLTSFSQAETITGELQSAGADGIVLNYNDWTKNDVKELVSVKAKPLGKLGSTSELNSIGGDSVSVYASVNNFTMEKGTWGYGQLSNTAIRVSSAYSRQSKYSPAFGVAISGVSPALIAPNAYERIFSQTLSSFKSKDIGQMGYGDWSTKLVSNFSKRHAQSRNDTMNMIADGYSNAESEGQKLIAAGANSYVLPYISAVTDVPVYSSGFTITDYDIPFYQMVVHGYLPYSSKAVNSSPQASELFMRALAAGSDVNYDMIYEDADELLDSIRNDLYYSTYSGWVDMAGAQAQLTREILAPVSDYTISDYTIVGDVITTTYSKLGASDVQIEVDLKNCIVRANGKVYDLEALGAVEKGGAEY